MKFSVNYNSNVKDQADEIRCSYLQMGYMMNFIKAHPEKRYVIVVNDLSTSEAIQHVNDTVTFITGVAEDYTIECGSISVFHQMKSRGYNAFVKFPVNDWETYQSLRKLEVSDIYIDSPLAFECEKIAKSKGDIKIRVSPQMSINASLVGASPESFFIRPEDLHLYEGTVDIVDFRLNGVDDIEKADTLFNIYKRGYFNNNIDSLVKGLPPVNNALLDGFGENRLNCGQRCLVPGRSCHMCFTKFEIAKQYIRAFGQ